jgi:hypothetical protein
VKLIKLSLLIFLLLTLASGLFLLHQPPVGSFDFQADQAIFLNRPVTYNLQQLYALTNTLITPAVLGESSEEKWLEVDLSEQHLYAYESTRLVYNFPVSTGKWAPTPIGEFRIWAKVKYQRMTGGRRENNTYYNLPNVPFIQYFHKGYGLHGAYWHNNFGQPMSHGCVNLPVAAAETLFYWTSPPYTQDRGYLKPDTNHPGTRIIIHP